MRSVFNQKRRARCKDTYEGKYGVSKREEKEWARTSINGYEQDETEITFQTFFITRATKPFCIEPLAYDLKMKLLRQEWIEWRKYVR
jgi:hypothetical protein